MCPTLLRDAPFVTFFPLLFPSFPPPSLSHYHSLLYTSPFSPKDSIWVSVEVGWGGYPSQRSSSFQSHHLWSIVFPTVMRFKGPPYSQRWDTNGAITEEQQPPNLVTPSTSVSDWICSHWFSGSFVFQVVSGYLTTGLVLWIVSNIPSDTKPSTLHCLITNEPPGE